MKGEETYSPAEASRVLGRSGRKSEEGDRLIAELEEERAERRHLAEHLEAEQRRGFWSRLFGREVARRFGRYRGYADFHAGGNFVLTEFSEVQLRDGERFNIRRVMSSSCSHPSPTKE
jgi:hypothetical protein